MQNSMQDFSDEQLMQAYAAGNVAAFDVLYARHEGALFRFVGRVLGSKLAAQADEVFQDCWLRIVTARDSFAPERGRWKTWAYPHPLPSPMRLRQARTGPRCAGVESESAQQRWHCINGMPSMAQHRLHAPAAQNSCRGRRSARSTFAMRCRANRPV